MPSPKPKYHLNKDDEFVIENYNFSKAFANFFPGIAGKYGIPMWVFYVNRGQCISSFGTQDKDRAILEFQPANKAWNTVFQQGFRTFLKVSSGSKEWFYEPFGSAGLHQGYSVRQRMFISAAGLRLEEANESLGISTEVEYFTIPQDSYAALARKVTFTNTEKTSRTLTVIDGLPQIVPFGENNFLLKELSRTLEAWIEVENLESCVPFYKLAVDPADRPQVVRIAEGNFFLGFHYQKGRPQLIRPIVDVEAVFGRLNDFSVAQAFIANKRFVYPKQQVTKSRTPAAFVYATYRLSAGARQTFYELAGSMRNREILNSSLPRILEPGYIERKQAENKRLIAELVSDVQTSSSSRAFDLYVQQTYLDNVLRGGYPVTFEAPGKGKTVFYLYSRKHGDLERDYNRFHIQPTYFSQGNGNYRDVNQNRRSDVWFNPDIQDENVIAFFNLLQTDGFNPLVVKGARFLLQRADEFFASAASAFPPRHRQALEGFFAKSFTPGEVIFFLEEQKIELSIPADEFLGLLLSFSVKVNEAEHGEGFWSDHWTYNLDLLESYWGVYPEKVRELFFEKRVFTYFDNAETVKPRHQKYVLLDGAVRKLHSVGLDNTKKEMIAKRSVQPHLVRSDMGTGPVYYTTLANKLLCLLANKLASLDPHGVGIEMEADKPNWFDALNGLPALTGSSLCETFELKRLALLLSRVFADPGVQSIPVTQEVWSFLSELGAVVRASLDSAESTADYLYWDKSNTLKESYRDKTRMGLSGKEVDVSFADLRAIVEAAVRKVDAGIAKAFNKKAGTYAGYFINEVVEHEKLSTHHVKPLRFVQKALPLFLEAQMHGLRIAADRSAAQRIHAGTKASALFDTKLRMYKVTDSLLPMGQEIGRCRVFTPGWLEHESIWLHMEYKYLLEILKQGLYDEFFAEFKNVLVAFQDPAVYGRSILENSSFIASSAFFDKNLHGNGFVARLSGSTAEFIQMWLIMNIGSRPFSVNSAGELEFSIKPALAGWLFDRKGRYSFAFLRSINVTYYNPARKDTFGKDAAKVKKVIVKYGHSSAEEFASQRLPSAVARKIRERAVEAIEVYWE